MPSHQIRTRKSLTTHTGTNQINKHQIKLQFILLFFLLSYIFIYYSIRTLFD